MMNKKGYLRTLEVFIVFVITFGFLIFIAASRHASSVPERPNIYILKNFEQRPDFRECVHSLNTSCLTSMVNTTMPRAYDFHVTVNDASYTRDDNLFVDTLYITGNSSTNYYIVRLYYWR